MKLPTVESLVAEMGPVIGEILSRDGFTVGMELHQFEQAVNAHTRAVLEAAAKEAEAEDCDWVADLIRKLKEEQ